MTNRINGGTYQNHRMVGVNIRTGPDGEVFVPLPRQSEEDENAIRIDFKTNRNIIYVEPSHLNG